MTTGHPAPGKCSYYYPSEFGEWNMKISVVTVCRNAEKTIAYTVQSFLSQAHPDKELLIIDGDSTDGTLEVVRRFQNPAIRVISESDRGTYDAMNKGLKLFAGDAVGFLNADDAFHDEAVLGRIAGGLSQADAVHGDVRIVFDHAEKRVFRNWVSSPFQPGLFRTGWMPPHPTFYVRRPLAAEVGFFDLNYKVSADYDFMLRALELRKARARYIPKTLVDFMSGGQSTKGLAAIMKANLECLRSRRRHLGAPIVDLALVSKPLRKLAQIQLRPAKR